MGRLASARQLPPHNFSKLTLPSLCSTPSRSGFCSGARCRAGSRSRTSRTGSWRRHVVAALDEISAELGCDVVVPQTVVVERYWHEIVAGLSQRSVALRAFTLIVAPVEHERRIRSDHVDAEAAGWRRERRFDFDAALPWLGNTTTVIDTTGKSPREVADAIDRHVAGSR